MSHSAIKTKNARIEVIDHIENDDIYLNIYFDNKPKGEHEQVVLSRRSAKALAILIQGDD